MRRVGNGYQGLKRFLTLMNHPPPMTEKTIVEYVKNFIYEINIGANMMKEDACDELRNTSENQDQFSS